MNSNQHAGNRNREPDPDEAWREVWSFVSNPSNSNVIMAIATVMIFFSGAIYTVFSGLQWEATKEAAQTAASQLEVIDRPWISIDIKPDGPIIFRNGAMSLTLDSNASNVGHSVATDVDFFPLIFPLDRNNPFDGPKEFERNACRNRALAKPGMFPLFPQPARLPYKITTFIAAKDFEEAKVKSGSDFEPMIAGCVTYRYPTSDRPHQTGFVYEVLATDLHRQIKMGEDVPQADIRIVPWFPDSFFAN